MRERLRDVLVRVPWKTLLTGPTGASLALFAMLALYWTIGLTEVFRVEGLYSFDPWFHLAVSEEVASHEDLLYGFDYRSGFSPFHYVTSMWILVAAFDKVAGVDPFFLFKVLGLFARTVTALVLYLVAMQLSSHRGASLVAPALLLTSPYMYWRSLITFPENIALIFAVLVLYGMVVSFKRGKPVLLLALFVAAHLYVHYRSALISLSLLGVAVVYGLGSRRFKIRDTAIFAGQLAILTLPVLPLAAQQYYLYSIGIVGPGGFWAQFATGARYAAPQLETYINNLGIVLIVLGGVGIAAVARRPGILGLLLLLWTGGAFLLTQGPGIQIYVPIDRMFAYLALPLALLGALGANALVKLVRKAPRPVKGALTLGIAVAIVTSLVVVLPTVHGWEAYTGFEMEAVNWMNRNVEQGQVIILAGGDLLPFPLVTQKGALDVARFDEWAEVIRDRQDQVWSLLNESYPGKTVYLVVKATSALPEGDLVFENQRILIYRFQAEG